MDKNNYNWLRINETDSIASNFLKSNEVKAVIIEGSRYCLGKIDNRYYALKDRCPHAGASLGTGWCDNSGNVVCPVHRIAFDLKTGKNTSGEGYYALSYPVEIEENTLYIGIEKKKWFQFWR